MDTERLLLFLEDKISDADLDQVRDMLSDDVDTKFVGDSRRRMTVDTMPFGTTASVIRDMAKISAAVAAVRPYVGTMAMDGYTTPGGVYRAALVALGHDARRIPEQAAEALWPALRGHTKSKTMSAGDAAEMRRRFPAAFSLKVR